MSESFFTAALIVSAVVDGLIVWAAMVLAAQIRSGARYVTPVRLLAAALIAGGAFLIKALIHLELGFDIFGVIHVAYLDAFALAPLMGLLLLASDRLRGPLRVTPVVRLLTAAAVVALPAVGVYASFVEPFRVQFEQTTVALKRERKVDDAIRIGVLADIQTSEVGPHQHQWIDRLMAASPDLIVIPGDLLQAGPGGYEEQAPKMRALLAKLHAPGGVFFVPGDCEWRDGGREIIQGLPIVHLNNEIARTAVRGTQITLCGLELLCWSPAARAAIDALEKEAGNDDVRILLSHRPDAVFELSADSRVDLVISGHTHGGQVQFPLIGPLLTLSDVPNSVAAGGLHQVSGCSIYVSRGLGWEGGQAPRLRLLCPPEISLLTLRRR